MSKHTSKHTTPLRERTAAAKRKAGPNPCRWFALCENTATTTETHPVLGAVPICARCKARVDAA